MPRRRYHPLAQGVVEAAGAAGRGWDLGHYGMIVPYVPAGCDEAAPPVLRALSRRVRGADVQDVVVTDPAGLPPHVLRYVEGGASKFVALPVVAPRDWAAEIAWLQEAVARPLRELELPG